MSYNIIIEFDDYFEHALRDHLVCGICSESREKWLLAEINLTLATAVKLVLSI